MPRIGLLAHLAVDLEPEVELVRIVYRIRRHQPGPEHRITVDGLAETLELGATQGHVQCDAVARDVGHGIVAVHLVAARANHHAEFNFVVVAPMRKTQLDGAPTTNQRTAGLQEQTPISNRRHIAPVRNGRIRPAFVQMGLVVDRCTDDLARVRHRRLETHVGHRMAHGIRHGSQQGRAQARQRFDEQVLLRQRVVLRGQPRQHTGNVKHRIVLHQAQAVTIETANSHATASSSRR